MVKSFVVSSSFPLTKVNDIWFFAAYPGLWKLDTGPSGVENKDGSIPSVFMLNQNYPNPFNPSTIIQFALPLSGFVTLKVFNIAGEEVANLNSKELPAGTHSVQWDATGFASGVYFYRLQAGTFTETKKLLFLR